MSDNPPVLTHANFTTSTTGSAMYDAFLHMATLRDMQDKLNMTGAICSITPEDYIEQVAAIYDSTAEQIVRSRTDPTTQALEAAMKSGDIFPICVIDRACKTHEGLHRMIAAGNAFGHDIQYPVLIVVPYDLDQWNRSEELKVIDRYDRTTFVSLVEYAVEQLKDTLSPVPDNIAERMKQTLEELATYDDHVITVICEVSTHHGDKKLDIFLTSLDGVERKSATASIASPWLSDMFQL